MNTQEQIAILLRNPLIKNRTKENPVGEVAIDRLAELILQSLASTPDGELRKEILKILGKCEYADDCDPDNECPECMAKEIMPLVSAHYVSRIEQAKQEAEKAKKNWSICLDEIARLEKELKTAKC